MSNLILPIMSFDHLSTMSVPRSGKIAHNTWINRYPDRVEVTYHATTIAIIYRDKVKITSGGWPTRTTADRLNAITRDNGLGSINIRRGDMLYTPRGSKIGPDSVLVNSFYLELNR